MYQKSSNSFIKHLDFILLDLLFLLLSFWLSTGIHLHVWLPSQYDTTYILVPITISLIHICIAVFTSMYEGILRRSYLDEFRAVCQHVLIIVAVLLFCVFFTKRYGKLSRLVVVYMAIFSLVLLTLDRDLWKLWLRNRMKQNPRLLLLVADESRAASILKKFGDNRIDFRVVGVVLPEKEGAFYQNPDKILGFPVVAHTNTMLGYLSGHLVDELLFSLPPGDKTVSQDLIQHCALTGVSIHLDMTPTVDIGNNAIEEDLAGIPVLTSSLKLVTSGQVALKRFLDIVGSIIGLIITCILWLFVAPGIYISDGGPIFFKQERIGKNGRTFKMYKFRSMYKDADERKKYLARRNNINPQMFKMDNDPRILGSGRDGSKHGFGYFIRRTSIDEFPQFWNVLKGEMSLVGTRPPTPDEYKEYEARHKARLAIKPGITGLWQVSGRSDITDFEEVVKLDVKYIQDWSVWLDFKILAMTVVKVITRKGSK